MKGVTSYRTKKGDLMWKADFYLRQPDGVEKRVIKRGIPTQEMAKLLVSKASIDAFEGRWFDRPKARTLTVRAAWEAFEPVCKRDNRSWKTTEARARRVVEHLGNRRAETLTLRDVDAFRERRARDKGRKKDRPAVATVNREVSVLRQILTYAVKCGDLDRNPLSGVAMLDEDNIRDVVVSEAEFKTLVDAAEAPLKPILVTAYDTGMRKREVLDLRWNQVDLKDGTIRLAASDTKTKQPRIIVLTSRVKAALQALPRSTSGYVFVNPEKNKPWNHIQKVFDRAKAEAKLEKIWFHDLRRSFVTNARRRGIPESVVMKMSGHRTREVFTRYNIIEEEDIRVAAVRFEQGCLDEEAANESERRESEKKKGEV
jgi:integrase